MSGCKREEFEFDVQIYTLDNNVDIAPHLCRYCPSFIQCKNHILESWSSAIQKIGTVFDISVIERQSDNWF